MSQEWERNLTSIVKETETNLARVRERLDGTEYKSFASGLSTHPMSNGGKSLSTHPMSNGGLKYSTPTKPLPSSTSGITGLMYDTYQPSGYQGIRTHSAMQEDYRGTDTVSDHSPALVAMLSQKVDTQNKLIEDLVRQVKSLERDREQTSTRLRNMEREMMAVSRRLEESGVHLETERKMERTQQELRMHMNEIENQVRLQKHSGVSESVYSDDVLTSMTRELHDFKRQTHEECDSLHREVESLRTRMVKTEVEVSGQQADSREVNRRLDRLDRTVTSVSDSQRVQCKDINQSLRQKHSTDKELDHLRTNMGRLMHTVDRLEHDSAVTLPTSNLMSAGQAAAIVHGTQTNTGMSTHSPYWTIPYVSWTGCCNCTWYSNKHRYVNPLTSLDYSSMTVPLHFLPVILCQLDRLLQLYMVLKQTQVCQPTHLIGLFQHNSAVTLPTSNLMSAGQAAAIVHGTQTNTESRPKRKPHRRDHGHVKLKPLPAGITTLDSSSEDDTNQYDISTTLSLDTSSSDDDISAMRQHVGSRLPTGATIGIPGEDVNELLSDLDDNFEGQDEPLGIADLSDTPSISSVELDSDLF
ncbi:uncharacterized protein [Amphiura filiformis]|uniref:uncharacterized protein n=1 Tax=Amphiura filiformis TaxID=82378 RepID=UPI003B212F0B